MTDPAPSTTVPGDLPISVRRARPGDTHAVLDFARTTWDGWDYIPSVWQEWLEAPDGVVLVATPRAQREIDRFGRPLQPDRQIAIARVAMLSPDEAWLEGLRVDPGVRNRGVARLFHGACLAWARAQGATSVRYATGEDNEGSHRLGLHHGFRLLRPWRSYQPPHPRVDEAEEAETAASATLVGEDEFADLADEATGEVPADVAEQAMAAAAPDEEERTAEAPAGEPGVERAREELEEIEEREEDREELAAVAGEPWAAAGPPSPALSGATATLEQAALEKAQRRLRRAGLLLDPGSAPDLRRRWWERVRDDPTFAMGDRLYEFRSWAFQELTEARFAAHVRAGEVLVMEEGSGRRHRRWALAVLPLGEALSADQRPWAALVAGDGAAVLDLAVATGRALARPLRLRIPDGAPLVTGHEDAFIAAGFPPARETLHLLARPLPSDAAVDLGDPGMVVFAEPPRRVTVPPGA